MTRKELYNVLDEAVGNAPRVDLAEAAWAKGVGMRRRRRAAFAGGGTLLAAAAVVGALVISGGIAPDEDVAPAVPTSTPEPTQVEPGPADMSQARTYLFNRSGTTTDLDTSSLQTLGDQGVPSVDELSGSSWELAPMVSAPGVEDVIDIAFAGPEDTGATEPTTLSFLDAEDGDTLLSISIDECGGATFQEDLVLGADGRFAGQSASTDDQGCPDGVQAAEDLWMEALPAGGWLHQPHEDVLLLSVVVPEGAAPTQEPTEEPTGGSTEEPTSGDPTGEPTGGGEESGATAPSADAASIGGGYGVALPEGWIDVPLWRDSDSVTDTTCLLPDGAVELFYPKCSTGVDVRVGVDPEAPSANEGGWWNPGEPWEWDPPEECYVARRDYGVPENAATFGDPETGTTTVGDHPVEWFRWPASCAGGQEFTAEAWRVTDLNIELRSMDGSHDVEPLAQALVLDREIAADTQVAVKVAGPIGDTLNGELQEWTGVYRGTGEQVSYRITDDTRCLVTKPGGELGADLQVGACADLTTDVASYAVARVVVTPDDEVVSVHVVQGF